MSNTKTYTHCKKLLHVFFSMYVNIYRLCKAVHVLWAAKRRQSYKVFVYNNSYFVLKYINSSLYN